MTERTVRGHTCDGLKLHWQNASYSCIPSFGNDGQINGCDDVNYTYIVFCPYCAIILPTMLPDDAD